MQLDTKLRLLTESLARAVDRRKFLKGASASLFAGVTALASGHVGIGRASATRDPSTTTPPWPPVCVSPGPYYCTTTSPIPKPIGDGSGCNGSRGPYDPGGACFQHRHKGEVLQCRISYCCYQAGCWTTPVKGGAWTCCDCECGDPVVTMCGCAQFSASPPPRPDGPQT